MSLFCPDYTFGTKLNSWGTTRPNTANGVAVTPNAASDAYGTAVALGSALTSDCYGIMININTNAGSVASRNSVIQLMVDPNGGTSYTAVLTGLLCGSAGPYVTSGGMWYYFPYFIKSGATIAVAARGSVATAFRVGYKIYQQPENALMMMKGKYFETLGVTVGTGTAVGTTIVPGTTSDGSWTSIGTTTKDLWWWQVGFQLPVGDTSWGALAYHVDIGVGSATTPDIIISDALFTTTAAEQLEMVPNILGCTWNVPAGSTLYARVQNSGTNETGNYSLAIYGMGG